MTPETSFHELLKRVRAGDPEAVRELATRFEPDVRRAAREPLRERRLQRLLDSADVSQMVLTEFFARVAEGQFDLDEADDLVKLLGTMARNQVRDQSRHHRAVRRDHRRQPDLSEHCLGGLVDDGPTPSHIVSTRELIAEISRRLSPDERDLLEQRALGHEWTTLARGRGTTAVALRKKLTRALNRVATELGLNDDTLS
jgi:hypothetical protein